MKFPFNILANQAFMNSYSINNMDNQISVRKSDLIVCLSNTSFKNKVIGNISNLYEGDRDMQSSESS